MICADSGHINVHETGAVEATGHKVLALPSKEGKITGQQIKEYYDLHWSDESQMCIRDRRIGVFGDSSRRSSVALLVGTHGEHLVLLQLLSDLGRPTAFHAHGEDALHDRSSLRVNKPVLRVLRVF